MNRRRFLLAASSTAGSTLLAGCPSDTAPSSSAETPQGVNPTAFETPTETATDAATDIESVPEITDTMEVAVSSLDSVWPIESTAELNPETNAALAAFDPIAVQQRTAAAVAAFEELSPAATDRSDAELTALQLSFPVVTRRNSFYALLQVVFRKFDEYTAALTAGNEQTVFRVGQQLNANTELAVTRLEQETDAIADLESHSVASPIPNLSLSTRHDQLETLKTLYRPVDDLATGFNRAGLMTAALADVVAAKNAEAYGTARSRLEATASLASEAVDSLAAAQDANVPFYQSAVAVQQCRSTATTAFVEDVQPALDALEAGETDRGESRWQSARSTYTDAVRDCR